MVYRLCKQKIERFWGDVMENYDLSIKWDTGYMNLHCELFFPCTQKKMLYLVKKVIPLSWLHQDEIFKDLQEYFVDRIQRTEAALEETKKKVWRKFKGIQTMFWCPEEAEVKSKNLN